jgi:hypothetical protein
MTHETFDYQQELVAVLNHVLEVVRSGEMDFARALRLGLDRFAREVIYFNAEHGTTAGQANLVFPLRWVTHNGDLHALGSHGQIQERMLDVINPSTPVANQVSRLDPHSIAEQSKIFRALADSTSSWGAFMSTEQGSKVNFLYFMTAEGQISFPVPANQDLASQILKALGQNNPIARPDDGTTVGLFYAAMGAGPVDLPQLKTVLTSTLSSFGYSDMAATVATQFDNRDKMQAAIDRDAKVMGDKLFQKIISAQDPLKAFLEETKREVEKAGIKLSAQSNNGETVIQKITESVRSLIVEAQAQGYASSSPPRMPAPERAPVQQLPYHSSAGSSQTYSYTSSLSQVSGGRSESVRSPSVYVGNGSFSSSSVSQYPAAPQQPFERVVFTPRQLNQNEVVAAKDLGSRAFVNAASPSERSAMNLPDAQRAPPFTAPSPASYVPPVNASLIPQQQQRPSDVIASFRAPQSQFAHVDPIRPVSQQREYERAREASVSSLKSFAASSTVPRQVATQFSGTIQASVRPHSEVTTVRIAETRPGTSKAAGDARASLRSAEVVTARGKPLVRNVERVASVSTTQIRGAGVITSRSSLLRHSIQRETRLSLAVVKSKEFLLTLGRRAAESIRRTLSSSRLAIKPTPLREQLTTGRSSRTTSLLNRVREGAKRLVERVMLRRTGRAETQKLTQRREDQRRISTLKIQRVGVISRTTPNQELRRALRTIKGIISRVNEDLRGTPKSRILIVRHLLRIERVLKSQVRMRPIPDDRWRKAFEAVERYIQMIGSKRGPITSEDLALIEGYLLGSFGMGLSSRLRKKKRVGIRMRLADLSDDDFVKIDEVESDDQAPLVDVMMPPSADYAPKWQLSTVVSRSNDKKEFL